MDDRLKRAITDPNIRLLSFPTSIPESLETIETKEEDSKETKEEGTKKRTKKEPVKIPDSSKSLVFTVFGSSGTIYTVSFSNKNQCTCPDYYIRKKVCKHINKVSLKVFQMIPEETYTEEHQHKLLNAFRAFLEKTQNKSSEGIYNATSRCSEDDDC